jgi:membrane protein YqaA with SNARE-associated domain
VVLLVGIDALLSMSASSLGPIGFAVFQWLIVFVINIVPAFMPPTWMVLSFLNIYEPQNIWVLVFIGVTASTTGRFALAKLSGFVTERFANREKKREFNAIKDRLQGKPMQKFIFTFIYALTPLPSNALFIAFGATKTRLHSVLAGFFAGRTLSYLFLVFTTKEVFTNLQATIEGNANLWTIVFEVLGILAIIIFFVIDWNKLILLEPPTVHHKWPKKNRHLRK